MCTSIALEAFDLGISDALSGEKLKAHFCVDFDDECPNKGSEEGRPKMYFAKGTQGLMVLICLPCAGEVYGGVRVEFIVAELEREMQASGIDNVFGWVARAVGHTKETLRALIEEYAFAYAHA